MEPKAPNKFWLISDEDVQALCKSLTGDALHTLESGLHITGDIPADYRWTAADQALHEARWRMAEIRWRLTGLLSRPITRKAETDMLEMMVEELSESLQGAEGYLVDDHSFEWPYPLG